MSAIEAALSEMLGPSVAIGITDPREARDDLWPQERAAMARAVPKRLHEFAAGRRAARAALAKLGLPETALPQAATRAVAWPAGVTGSISHTDRLCVAALSRTHRSLGLDIEPATPLEPDLEEVICTKVERLWLDRLPDAERGLMVKQIFCAKEAFYKAHAPLGRHDIGFEEVSLEYLPEQGLFRLKTAPAPTPDHVAIRLIEGLCLATCQIG